MDGTAAINFNLEALKRILAGLVSMAGLSSGGGCGAEGTPTRQSDDCRPPLKGEVKAGVTLPRHVRLAILRLLRPAEAAARRLIIASARGLVVVLPPQRKPMPKPVTVEPQLRRFGIAVVMSPADLAAAAILPRSRGRGTAPRVWPKASPRTGSGGGGGGLRASALPLFDPPRRLRPSSGRRTVPAHAAPRILFPGSTVGVHREAPASCGPRRADDPIDATRLGLRLAALAAALDDLPGQAKRFARWRARNDADARRSPAPGRVRRLSPLRPGRPPGGRLARFDPSVGPRRNIREVDEILAHAHALALYALERPDTS